MKTCFRLVLLSLLGVLAIGKVSAQTTAKPHLFAIRTNLLYDAFLLPTMGIEWRVTRDIGIKFDGSRSWWGTRHGKVQKIWLANPEVRWYLMARKRFYVGAAANVGQYNVYREPIGSLRSKDVGYQGDFWNAGVTLGYQLLLSRCCSLDFNLGLGYSQFKYDIFRLVDGVRTVNETGKLKKIWGPMQAGVNFVWTIGGNR